MARPTEVTRPRTLGGMVYLGVLTGALAGVVVAALGPWRFGVVVLALSMLLGAAARLMITDASAGMLKVRNRYLDAAVLAILAVVMIFLAATIPDQPR
ncbi:DUF3017 domain-containing protein [Nocardioides sp. AE5]|uniref:DUF3017 domain-containing protein n=1 Tax=Nocardioides sp. AE5 TaxID=2962573 RepID=UPI0028823309|nr:DUF3017 domain-containing protein [Nocardioides sp. AE5]MDT0201988.1 DUF3017 domain-containing protein [Nocardioides sp. AE5]